MNPYHERRTSMKKIATAVASVVMLAGLAGPALAATPKAAKAGPAKTMVRNCPAGSHRTKGPHSRCVAQHRSKPSTKSSAKH
jgi:hypothetical protein